MPAAEPAPNFPPWPAVYYYLARWRADGAFERLSQASNRADRLAQGRRPTPSLALVDDQLHAMAKRAAGLGFRIMINFHYSDTWADPGSRASPPPGPATLSRSCSPICTPATFSTMTALKAADVTPEWVQVGNEIPGGLLWPEGSTANFGQLSQLLNQGYATVKAVSPASKIVIHLDRANDNALYRNFFDQHMRNGGQFEVIGMSYYPYWFKQNYTASIASLQANLLDSRSAPKAGAAISSAPRATMASPRPR